MKYKKFYTGILDKRITEDLDREHKEKMDFLMGDLEQGNWTKKQKKRQKNSILPLIALYMTFVDKGLSEKDAREQASKYSFHVAEKRQRVLKTAFAVPGFFRIFRFFMRKGMSGEEIWTSRILSDDSQKISMDVHKCLWADTCSHFDCYEVCEIFCLCDHIVFGNIEKLKFERSQTLGMNGEKCDFRFRSADK